MVQMGTFSKALGSSGAFIAGSRSVTDWLLNTARTFMFSTAPAPCVAGASLAALRLMGKSRRLVRRLWENRERLATGLRRIGCNIGDSETPVIPLLMGGNGDAPALSSFLRRKKIYAPLIRPPSVRESRLRITVTAAHHEEHIDSLIGAVKRFRQG